MACSTIRRFGFDSAVDIIIKITNGLHSDLHRLQHFIGIFEIRVKIFSLKLGYEIV